METDKKYAFAEENKRNESMKENNVWHPLNSPCENSTDAPPGKVR